MAPILGRGYVTGNCYISPVCRHVSHVAPGKGGYDYNKTVITIGLLSVVCRRQWEEGLANRQRDLSMNELHRAARDGATERTVALLSRGVIDIDEATTRAGATALMLAALFGHSRIVGGSSGQGSQRHGGE